jgi:hypothetical protein
VPDGRLRHKGCGQRPKKCDANSFRLGKDQPVILTSNISIG